MIARRGFVTLAAAAACPAWPQAAGAPEALPPVVAQVRQRIGSDPVLRGEFEQRKAIKGFKNPLVSRGDFLVIRDRGVVWRTREPFPSTMVVTRERLLTRQANGSTASQLDAREEPALRAINETLFALMAADLGVLAQRFRIEGELRGADAWRLSLTPRDGGLARWLASVELEGDRFVRAVRLAEAQGDTSTIRFIQPSGAAAPTREEAGRFD